MWHKSPENEASVLKWSWIGDNLLHQVIDRNYYFLIWKQLPIEESRVIKNKVFLIIEVDVVPHNKTSFVFLFFVYLSKNKFADLCCFFFCSFNYYFFSAIQVSWVVAIMYAMHTIPTISGIATMTAAARYVWLLF